MKLKLFFSKINLKTVLMLFFLYAVKIQAQYVTIPDTSLLAFFKTHFPTCFSGNLMDTTCKGVVSCKFLDFDYSGNDSNISNLDGVQYFDSLLILNFGYLNVSTIVRFPPQLQSFAGHSNPITSLPPIPESVNSIYFDYHHLKQLPKLPDSLEAISVRYGELTSLPDLPNGLTSLSCENNALTSLPELPSGLQYMTCQFNQLKSLPKFPSSLTMVEANNNSLDSLPELPPGLLLLNCSHNNLSKIPSLPNSLHDLFCSVNKISVLPKLPLSLSIFWCDSNYLDSLPAIPAFLQRLECGFNQLDSLPAFNSRLLTLNCQNNQLTELPELPANLRELNCSFNSISKLPALSKNIVFLICNNNELIELPQLMSDLDVLDCSYNYIKCFNPFPDNSTMGNPTVKLDHNLFKCLPNYTFGMDSATLKYPICKEIVSGNNPYDCPCQISINGTVYLDSNNNCKYDSGEILLNDFPVTIRDKKMSLVTKKYTLMNGKYEFPAYSNGIYYVTIDTSVSGMTVRCAPGTDSVIVQDSLRNVNKTIDFGLNCKPGFDYGIMSIIPVGYVFPGKNHAIKIRAGDITEGFANNCVSGIGGSVTITISGKANYIGHWYGMAPSKINGNEISYDIADFNKIKDYDKFILVLNTDTSAKSTDSICVYVELTTTKSGDRNTMNNTKKFCYKVMNSFDPNMKEVYPVNISPGYNDWLTYTIHFQNTGNAPAYDIRLADTLDTRLDPETFQVLGYSHPMQTTLHGNIISFKFKDILLPDSHSNSDSSHGFVQYRVKPLKDLSLGTKIRNTAYIYFDYNDPVVTNTTVNEYVKLQSSSIGNSSSQIALNIFPNPSDGKINITSGSPYLLMISDITGKILYNQNDLSEVELEKGLYFFDVTIDGIHFMQKVIVY